MMNFKEFETWCNYRACDGCWGSIEALACIDIIKKINKFPFWKRNKTWKEQYEKRVIEEIIIPLDKIRKECEVIDDDHD